MAAATSPATPAASPATSGSNRGRRLSKVHRATEWLRPSFARSSATMSASVRDQMPKPSCVSCQLGSPTTTRFTRTRLSDIVHPVSSSQLTQDPNRVRSFGGYNTALAMTTLPSDKPLNDARHAVVTTLSDLVKALETDPTPQPEKIEKAKAAIRNLLWDLRAIQELRLRRLAE